ncbi:MAG TPA: DNA polymerase Y family protein [Candidatus Binataceae bacterium]|nr:DNA polymerase Y family protein [Candidatus Binataceae bacterium]
MPRIACILVPDFSLAAIVRANPEQHLKPLAISNTNAPHAELLAVSLRARKSGIRPGMTIAQARSIIPDLTIVKHSEAAETSAMDALADAAESVSPLIEKGDAGRIWLDLAGLERLMGNEEAIAAELEKRAAQVGLEASIGIASNKEIAHLAARCGGRRVIEPGQESDFLGWLPLDLLGLDADGADIEDVLARWGIRRLGELARLDPDAVGTRLGRRGVELIRIARGESPARLIPRRPSEIFTEAIELDYGIETLEPLGFVIRPMLERLCERLMMRGLVAGDIMLTFGLSDHRKFTRRVAIGAPSNDARAMLAMITLSLESAAPEAAVETIRIDVEPRKPRAAQADMFLPPAPAPDRLELTIARLASLCGPENVGTLRTEDSYRPEAVRLEKFDPPPPKPLELTGEVETHSIAQLAIRAIRPPLQVEVLMSRGAPEFVRGPSLGARVVSIAGPWRRDGEWWRAGDDPAPSPQLVMKTNGDFRRDYYEMALADGGVYRVYRDVNSAQWFVDGIYD